MTIGLGVVIMAVALAAAVVVTGAIIVLQIFSKPRKPDGPDAPGT